MCEEDGNVGDDGEKPGEHYQPPDIPDSPGGQGGDRVATPRHHQIRSQIWHASPPHLWAVGGQQGSCREAALLCKITWRCMAWRHSIRQT